MTTPAEKKMQLRVIQGQFNGMVEKLTMNMSELGRAFKEFGDTCACAAKSTDNARDFLIETEARHTEDTLE